MTTTTLEMESTSMLTAYAVHEVACTCGQSLDECCAAHCPRCGITLRG